MVDPELAEYLNSMKESGFSDEETQKKLLDAGWDPKEVNEALGTRPAAVVPVAAPAAAPEAKPAQAQATGNELPVFTVLGNAFNFMKGEFKFWKDFFLALLILQIALIIVTGVASFFMVGGVMEPSAMGFGNYANIITSSGPLILLTMGVSLIVGVISLIVQLGLMKGVDARLNGKAFTLQEGFSFGTSKIVVAIIASIITGLLVFFGLFFLVLPGIYLFVSLSLILPAIAIGDKEVGSSISESFRLIKGRWFKSFGLGITVFLVAVAYGIAVGIVLIPLTLIFGVLSNLGSGAMLFSSLLNQILQAVLVIPLNLFGMVVLAMYYRNLKECTPE